MMRIALKFMTVAGCAILLFSCSNFFILWQVESTSMIDTNQDFILESSGNIDAIHKEHKAALTPTIVSPSAVIQTKSTNTTYHTGIYDRQEYEKQLKISMTPLTNVTSGAYRHMFWAGFCNQYMMFIGMIILTNENNYSQILVESIRWKDTFGTNQQIRHDLLFDIVHWNSYYPGLPRMISYDPHVLPDVEIGGNEVSPRIFWKVDAANATNPHSIGEKQTSAVHAYLDYTNKVFHKRRPLLSLELDIMKGAFRPHPEIQFMIDGFIKSMDGGGGGSSYMVLHARIEPDMQKHGSCSEFKVTAFKDIVRMLQDQFAEPPVSTIIVILNREILEKEVKDTKKENILAAENLKMLNDLIANGLWGGRVRVVEAGSKLAIESEHEIYSKYSTIVGGIVNYFISLQANIFVGTQVSSYSSAVIKTRFFREKRDNYFYVPEGLIEATPANATQPPKFSC